MLVVCRDTLEGASTRSSLKLVLFTDIVFAEQQGYAPEDDTWEPRDTLIDGAEGVLKAYIDKQAAKGVTIPEDGPRRKSKARASEAAPPSVDSSSNKRKKKESLAAEPEEEERPRKKKEKVSEPIDLSPDPEPVPTKPHKSRKSQATEEVAPEDPPAAPASRPSSSKKKREEVPTAPEVERVAPQAASSKAEPSAKKFDAVVVEIPEITGSHVHRHAASWEVRLLLFECPRRSLTSCHRHWRSSRPLRTTTGSPAPIDGPLAGR